MEKVIFDTNFIRNTEPKQFLGGRSELEKFSKVAELILPDIVIEEIKNQKRRSLEKNKNSFLSNPFHWLRNLDDEKTKNFDVELHLKELEDSESLKYEVIKLTDFSVLEEMKERALKKLPPFEDKEGTDKGFKDACIYFTTLEYLQNIPDKQVFVCCKDSRLKEAFEDHPSVIIIESFDEFKANAIEEYQTDYFVEKLKEELQESSIVSSDITDYWFNINENHVLLINILGENHVVEVDSGEIIAFEKVSIYLETIDTLINSGTFAITHSAVEALSYYLNFLSDDEIMKIFEASIDNNQIRMIMDDDDIKQFIGTLYDIKQGLLTPELETKIRQKLGG